MDVKWSYQLKEHQKANPVVASVELALEPDVVLPNELQLRQVFGVESFGKAHRLKTWGRKIDNEGKQVLENDPHWIAVRNGTPLHYDVIYPRFSHHLKVRVDFGTFVRGMDKQELELKRGVFYILDTHSPHQVFLKHKIDAWNVAVSIDSDTVLPVEETIARCIDYARTHDFVTGKKHENI